MASLGRSIMSKKLLFFVFFLFIPNSYCQDAKSIFDIARKGSLEEIEVFLKTNPNTIDVVNNNGFTPLILACYSGNNKVATHLIEKGCNINYKSEMGTALMAAVVRGNTEMVNILLNHNADINSTDDNGVTALLFAVQFTNVEIVKILLNHKADKTLMDKEGKTAFEYAVLSGKDEIINLLK